MAYNQDSADTLCELLEDGKSLRAACLLLDLKPSTVLYWTKSNPAFFEQYARARDVGYRLLADELIAIADTPLLGVETKVKEDGSRETTEGDMLGHRKLQIDTRKWMLSKMLPKVYGDKLELDHSGEVKFTSITRTIVDPKANESRL